MSIITDENFAKISRLWKDSFDANVKETWSLSDVIQAHLRCSQNHAFGILSQIRNLPGYEFYQQLTLLVPGCEQTRVEKFVIGRSLGLYQKIGIDSQFYEEVAATFTAVGGGLILVTFPQSVHNYHCAGFLEQCKTSGTYSVRTFASRNGAGEGSFDIDPPGPAFPNVARVNVSYGRGDDQGLSPVYVMFSRQWEELEAWIQNYLGSTSN
jgi:hypothetical protein